MSQISAAMGDGGTGAELAAGGPPDLLLAMIGTRDTRRIG